MVFYIDVVFGQWSHTMRAPMDYHIIAGINISELLCTPNQGSINIAKLYAMHKAIQIFWKYDPQVELWLTQKPVAGSLVIHELSVCDPLLPYLFEKLMHPINYQNCFLENIYTTHFFTDLF